MSNIRALNIIKGYNHQAVEYFEELLERAKAGEITEAMCCIKLTGGQYEHCYTGCEDLHELVGILERTKYLTLRRMDT